jgi:hypothetical protein
MPINIFFIQLLNRVEILLDVFEGLVLYHVKISDLSNIKKTL